MAQADAQTQGHTPGACSSTSGPCLAEPLPAGPGIEASN